MKQAFLIHWDTWWQKNVPAGLSWEERLTLHDEWEKHPRPKNMHV